MAAHSYRADAPPSGLVRTLGWVVAVGGACAALGAVRKLDQPEGWLGLLMALVVVAATLMGGVAPGIAASIVGAVLTPRSEEHTSELQYLMRISYAVFCLKKKK